MKTHRPIVFIVAFVLIVGGCSKKSNPVTPPSSGVDFPQDVKFALTLYSPSISVAVGESFDVRVVLYNVSGVSGMALHVTYPAGNVDALSVTNGVTFFPPDSVISLSKIEADSGRIDFGVSYMNAASGISKSGTGLICTFKCKAKASGTASFVVDQSTLQINSPSGTLIANFAALLVENLSITIH